MCENSFPSLKTTLEWFEEVLRLFRRSKRSERLWIGTGKRFGTYRVTFSITNTVRVTEINSGGIAEVGPGGIAEIGVVENMPSTGGTNATCIGDVNKGGGVGGVGLQHC